MCPWGFCPFVCLVNFCTDKVAYCYFYFQSFFLGYHDDSLSRLVMVCNSSCLRRGSGQSLVGKLLW